MSATRMLFRTVKAGEFKGSVDAVIVDGPAKPGFVVCYAHVGQHGEGARAYFRDCTRNATPIERAALVRELRGIYGPIRILKRWPRDAGRA